MSFALTPFAILAILVGIVAIPFLVGVVLYNVLRLVFFVIGRVVGLIGGVVLDVVRFVGHVVVAALHVPLVLLNTLFLRFNDAGRYGRGLGHEVAGVAKNVWSAVVLRPLRFVGILEMQTTTESVAMPAAPATAMDFDALDDVAAVPKSKGGRPDEFDGYRVVGTLPRGGSGARLYIAEPKGDKAKTIACQIGEVVDRVVIKSFSMEEGSTMPQIVRESRALEAARDLGLVYEHRLEAARFYYVMPYVAGEDLATVTRDLHHDSDATGLNARSLRAALSYFSELLVTVERFHQKGLWHKDIKPSNVIVSKGRVHLVDLGLVTPLRSAMTLTTHGTEYFRDPDMVRLAMQGVKVHEVDGVKFDLYSAGALLYSMLENSFPAHGSLSRFSKNVPEALQWIVRRSMAEMHQRYGSASDMLADLQTVLNSANPYLLKPAALPSMQGKRMKLKDWQAGAPGAAFRQHGYKDRHANATYAGAAGGSVEERLRVAGARVNQAGERVREGMHRVTNNLQRNLGRHTARVQDRFQKRQVRKHRVRMVPVIAAGMICVMLLGMFGLTTSSGPAAFTPYTSASNYAVASASSSESAPNVLVGQGNRPPGQYVVDQHRAEQYVADQVVYSKDNGQRIVSVTTTYGKSGKPHTQRLDKPAAVAKPSPLERVTPKAELAQLADMQANQRLLLLDDLAGVESLEFRQALLQMPISVLGAGGESDASLDYIDALAEAKRAVGFAQPDNAGALGYLAEFLETREDLDAVYWIGHVGGRDDVLGRLVMRP